MSASKSLILKIRLEFTKNEKAIPKCTGWEKNESQKLLPKTAELQSAMDPVKLAENAVDLNLKLMRWRLVPSLDLQKISLTRCLILGSGTLGCYVARGLMVRCFIHNNLGQALIDKQLITNQRLRILHRRGEYEQLRSLIIFRSLTRTPFVKPYSTSKTVSTAANRRHRPLPKDLNASSQALTLKAFRYQFPCLVIQYPIIVSYPPYSA